MNFITLRAKRGGSLFEAGSAREEHGGPLHSKMLRSRSSIKNCCSATKFGPKVRLAKTPVPTLPFLKWSAREAHKRARSALNCSFSQLWAEGNVAEQRNSDQRSVWPRRRYHQSDSVIARTQCAHLCAQACLIARFHSYRQKEMSQSDKIRTEGPSGQDTGTTSWILLSRARSAHIRA